jgi:hypothetical protein
MPCLDSAFSDSAVNPALVEEFHGNEGLTFTQKANRITKGIYFSRDYHHDQLRAWKFDLGWRERI